MEKHVTRRFNDTDTDTDIQMRLQTLVEMNHYWRHFALSYDRQAYRAFMGSNPFHQDEAAEASEPGPNEVSGKDGKDLVMSSAEKGKGRRSRIHPPATQL
jgi:hypothetical protein